MADEKKTKGEVNYRPASPNSRQACGNCVMYSGLRHYSGQGRCSLVAGEIDPKYVCNRWEPKR